MGRLTRPIDDDLVYHALNRGNNRAPVSTTSPITKPSWRPWRGPGGEARSNATGIA